MCSNRDKHMARAARSPKLDVVVVQLGGLEPPTSCSTDRRSNQLSYNCILARSPKRGSRMGRKLGATPRFGKAAKHPIIVVLKVVRVQLERPPAWQGRPRQTVSGQQQARAHRPGFSKRESVGQAAGL